MPARSSWPPRSSRWPVMIGERPGGSRLWLGYLSANVHGRFLQEELAMSKLGTIEPIFVGLACGALLVAGSGCRSSARATSGAAGTGTSTPGLSDAAGADLHAKGVDKYMGKAKP